MSGILLVQGRVLASVHIYIYIYTYIHVYEYVYMYLLLQECMAVFWALRETTGALGVQRGLCS